MKKKINSLTDIKSVKDFEGYSVYEANELIRILEKQHRSRVNPVERPKKPCLENNTPTDLEIAEYRDAVKTYEENQRLYLKYLDDIKVGIEHWNIFKEFIKNESGLNTFVPQRYRNKTYQYAYDCGHSSGYGEVYVILCNLVDIFKN